MCGTAESYEWSSKSKSPQPSEDTREKDQQVDTDLEQFVKDNGKVNKCSVLRRQSRDTNRNTKRLCTANMDSMV